MSDQYSEFLNEMHTFYGKENPTEEDQFRFEEAMTYLSQETPEEGYSVAFVYNLAVHYMEIKEFDLAKKYLEKGAEAGDWTCKKGLGIIWYYGLCGEQNFEKAYRYFENRRFGRSAYLLADMYHYGYYVEQNVDKCRKILEEQFEKVSRERYAGMFLRTKYPEVALRLVRLNLEEGKGSLFELDSIYSARKILAIRQKQHASWLNLKEMRSVLEIQAIMQGDEYWFKDIYDLMIFDFSDAVLNFTYNNKDCLIYIIPYSNCRNQGTVCINRAFSSYMIKKSNTK